MLVQQNSEYLGGGADLPFPNATHVAGTWWVENPFCALLVQPASDLVIVHFTDCLLQLVSGAHKIPSVVAEHLLDWSTASNTPSQCLNEQVYLERICSLNVNRSACQTCEKASIAFKFLSAFLNHSHMGQSNPHQCT